MRRETLLTLLTLLVSAVCTTPAPAQHDHAAPAGPPTVASPYVGLQGREIRALSDTQLAQYRAGEGMGFALAAELNHYPGPKHTLQLADSLGLSTSQRATIVASRDRMLSEAERLGERIIEAERTLDRAFAAGTITDAQLRSLTDSIARLQGALRATHLAAHLRVRAALTPEQVRRYDVLRGYGAEEPTAGDRTP